MEPQPIERNLGIQPLDAILTEAGLNHHDIVAAADAPLTHKAILRARKGRLIKRPMQRRIATAVNKALAVRDPEGTRTFTIAELFTY